MPRNVFCGLALLAVVSLAWGQDPANPTSAAKRSAAARRTAANLPAFTPQREAAAVSFVQEHHPELAELLGHLKRDNHRQYERAVRELFRTSERLAQLKERDAERYAIDLEVWKLDSRIQLLAVRLRMVAEGEKLEKQLRAAIERKADLRLKRLELERARLQSRLEKLEQMIEKQQANRDKSVERSMNQVLHTIKPRVRPRKGEPDKLTSASGDGSAQPTPRNRASSLNSP